MQPGVAFNKLLHQPYTIKNCDRLLSRDASSLGACFFQRLSKIYAHTGMRA